MAWNLIQLQKRMKYGKLYDRKSRRGHTNFDSLHIKHLLPLTKIDMNVIDWLDEAIPCHGVTDASSF